MQEDAAPVGNDESIDVLATVRIRDRETSVGVPRDAGIRNVVVSGKESAFASVLKVYRAETVNIGKNIRQPGEIPFSSNAENVRKHSSSRFTLLEGQAHGDPGAVGRLISERFIIEPQLDCRF